jgi:Ca-activated chloride channel family protein
MEKKFLIIFLAINIFSTAISHFSDNISNKATLKEADKLFETNKYVEAMEIYKDLGLEREIANSHIALYIKDKNMDSLREAINYYSTKIGNEDANDMFILEYLLNENEKNKNNNQSDQKNKEDKENKENKDSEQNPNEKETENEQNKESQEQNNSNENEKAEKDSIDKDNNQNNEKDDDQIDDKNSNSISKDIDNAENKKEISNNENLESNPNSKSIDIKDTELLEIIKNMENEMNMLKSANKPKYLRKNQSGW